MQINYHLTEEDYLHFNLFHIKNSNTGRKALMIQRVLSPVMFVVIAFLFSYITETPFLFMFIPMFILAILWLIFYPKYFYNTIIRQSKKMIKEGKNNGLLGEHTMMLTEDGLSDLNQKGETKVNWSGIEVFKEDNDYFYLYNSSVSSYILPKRALSDEQEFRKYVQSKLVEVSE